MAYKYAYNSKAQTLTVSAHGNRLQVRKIIQDLTDYEHDIQTRIDSTPTTCQRTTPQQLREKLFSHL